MNTKHIPILLEVDHCRSINKAAGNLYMSQPQISHIIRSIEQEIGYQLFVRSKSGVTTTPQGQLYLESIRLIASELKKIKDIPLQFTEKTDISVSAVYSRFLFQAFLRFREQYPVAGESDCYMEAINELVIEKVVTNQVRLGILSRMRTLPGNIGQLLERYSLEEIPLRKDLPFQIIMGSSHPLASETNLAKEQLQNQSWVYYTRSSMSFLEDLLHLCSITAELLVSDRASFLEALDSGRYLSLSTTSSDKVTQGNKYSYLPVREIKHSSELCIIKPRLYKLTTQERRFLRFLRETFQKYYG